MIFLTNLLEAAKNLDDADTYKFCKLLEQYRDDFSNISDEIYSKLPKEDRAVFVSWFLKRWGKVSIVAPDQLAEYQKIFKYFSKQKGEPYELGSKNYRKVNFREQGYDFDLIQYDWCLGIHDIYYNQYENSLVFIEENDVILDLGAFIGDTAVLFDMKSNSTASIHCFELLDDNIELINANIKLNRIDENRITVNKLAVSEKSGQDVSIKRGTLEGATKIGSSDTTLGNDIIKTITVDEYVESKSLQSVNFIKMDIEGAEYGALLGARTTIQKFKPKLAICLYHLWDDPIKLPALINSFGVNYKFTFKWVHLASGWEAVLLAKEVSESQSEHHKLASNNETTSAHLTYAMHISQRYIEKYEQADQLWSNAKKKRMTMRRLVRAIYRRYLKKPN